MRYRLMPLVASLVLALVIAAPARALDLEQARADGLLVSTALALGAEGDWDDAQLVVANSDQLVRDIVLWRKLRAGQGSVAEYQGYVSRRASWPGGEALARVVLGQSNRRSGAGLGGLAAQNWSEFSRLWKARNYEEAEALLISLGSSPATLGDATVWADRRLSLARRAARDGRWQNAYAVASLHGLTPSAGYDYADSEWVAGWVALRKLGNADAAVGHFQRFRAAVETPISIGRGGYWLGRAYEALGRQQEANAAYADAATQQTSFYGQLAAAKIGATGDLRLTNDGLPDWRRHPAMRSEDVRLATVLHFAGEDTLSMATFSSLGRSLPPGALAPLTRLALDLGKPHFSVRIAKRAARRGVVIHPAYYPLHDLKDYVTKVEPAFALSIARQETELNPLAISRAGARGLMQLMPATARRVSGWIGEEYDRGRLLTDWRYNTRLGETYLARRTEQFGGSYVMAAAAYNAGAGRVDQWIDAYGDPRLGEIDVLDWMEQIPFNETRNYVQRVMEGLYVYRARLTGTAGPMTIEQDLRRGFRVVQ
ncbi:MAG: lytic transglycosylase domain-containing protein [Pseudomonadota bacterium]